MSLPSPNLDNRSFEQLLEGAKALIARSDCGWTDLSAGDPGTVLLEAFTYLTSLLIYRVNRLPEKVYVELLRLIGVQLAPPAAAHVHLRFTLAKEQSSALIIPAGTRVTTARSAGGEPVIFATVEPASIAPGNLVAEQVVAYHHGRVNGELAGVGTGLPRQTVTAKLAPIVAATGDGLDLIVGVEATPEELGERVPALTFEGKKYRIWQRADNFTEGGGPDSYTYLVDRVSGVITFAPALRAVGADGVIGSKAATLARVPELGRKIRLWYPHGGGDDGNLAANSLTVLKDPIPGLQVTNPEPATGGAPVETVENALLRGPEEMHSLHRAVTAGDFEALAVRSSGAVARAKAFTKFELWKHAKPGTVEVLLVPRLGNIDQRGDGVVTVDALRALETDQAQDRILETLDQRRPLGTVCLVNWVHYKAVRVVVRVVVYRGEDADAVRARVLSRLHLTINPLPTPLQRTGWLFGQPLRASHVYDIVLAEPGVSYVDQVRFLVDEVPETDVQSLELDPFQPSTWYATSGEIVFRSLNDGDSWEAAGRFAGEKIDKVHASPNAAGLLAVCTQLPNGVSRVHVSWDCGETWKQVAELAFAINDIAWIERDETHILLMATDKGLYEAAMGPSSSPVQLMVDKEGKAQGFYAVVGFVDGRGGTNVAVAARQQGGIFLSRDAGKTETYLRINPGGEDIRVLAVQRLGLSTFLWAGITAAGNEKGKGCLRWALPESPQSVESPEGWRAIPIKWEGGSCRALSFDGLSAYAATHFAGVARLDSAKPDSGWQVSNIQCGLPMRGSDKLFAPVQTVAVSKSSAVVMAGGAQGIFRSREAGTTFRFEGVSSKEFDEKVALPATWLFCSGAHEVNVVSADAANRD
ncbi:MAG: baseplate J/gp47 family protein [Burkholderiaceae bacterium]|nr:baseplate J/gp47 family protein [Burkholderiaceae bacterium]MDH3460569.1 baseplate J/gp47 family protein [Burkholderiaceae bacterium]